VDEIVVVGGSSRIPKVQRLLSDYFNGKELNKGVNPDEAVAYGAAVQAAVLSGARDEQLDSVLLIDVAPLSLGIEESSGLMDVLIPRGTAIPVTKTKTYSTVRDGQTAVMNKVYEGERKLAGENRLLGQFELSGFPAMPRGEAQIEVTLDVDENGILAVSARELTSSTEAEITISEAMRLGTEEVDRMIREAELMREDDEERARQMRREHAETVGGVGGDDDDDMRAHDEL